MKKQRAVVVRRTAPVRGLVWAATTPDVPGLTCRSRTRRGARELLTFVAPRVLRDRARTKRRAAAPKPARPLPARLWPTRPPVRIGPPPSCVLVLVPWAERLRAEEGDSDLWRAVFHLALDRVRVEDFPDRRKLAAFDTRIDVAVREIVAGRLRGARAAKRIDVIDDAMRRAYRSAETLLAFLPPRRPRGRARRR